MRLGLMGGDCLHISLPSSGTFGLNGGGTIGLSLDLVNHDGYARNTVARARMTGILEFMSQGASPRCPTACRLEPGGKRLSVVFPIPVDGETAAQTIANARGERRAPAAG